MDSINATEIFAFSTTSYSIEPNITFVFDNHTSDHVIKKINKSAHSFYLVGMAFLGGFVAGIIIRCLYSCVCKSILPSAGEAADPVDGTGADRRGVFNLNYVDDESRPPINDSPPDYVTVMEQENSADACDSTSQPFHHKYFGWLARRKSSNKAVNDSAVEELPPSYSSAVANISSSIRSQSR